MNARVIATPTTADPIAIAVELLMTFGQSTGNKQFSRAAAMLIAPAGGRPPEPDEDALDEVAWLVSQGKSVRRAAMEVASRLAQDERVEAMAERLRAKYRKLQKNLG
jgi:hypothetical protein